MKTAELPIGSHVTYDRNEANDYHSFVEAFVVDIRPRGNKSTPYWGGTNGNHNTIGITYKAYWNDPETGQPVWQTKWVRPQTIHFTWAEYTESVERDKKRNAEQKAAEKKAKANRKARLEALPQGVIKALSMSEYGVELLIDRGRYSSYNLTLEIIEAVVKAARASTPEAIQKEIEDTLALLG